jgi:hypothetical protein
MQTSLHYGYYSTKSEFGWPAPDEAWQARRQAFIGWPARNHKMLNKNPSSYFRFIKNPGSFFCSLRIQIHFFGS